MIDPSRVQFLNEKPIANGKYVLYWMQASQRSTWNPALEYAITRANGLGQPAVVCFGLTDNYPDANARHYAFMLQGLHDVAAALDQRGIAFVFGHGSPPEVALKLAASASLVVCDRGYLRHQRRWRDQLSDEADRQVVQLEADVVVPVEEASDKQEFAARTLRPKIHRLWGKYIVKQPTVRLKHPSKHLKLKSDFDLSNPQALLSQLKIDHTVGPSRRLTGGQNEARRRLRHFISKDLTGYADGRRDLSRDATSMLAAYLHFGQISPVEIALAAKSADALLEDREAFLEELIVRRELAMNYVYYQPNYDQFEGLPAWAMKTLARHESDKRTYVYSRQQLEQAKTHDPFWNAAQIEMTSTGYMHNAMRMYWGKKILEWKQTPREAFDDALYLNNKYFLCGRDPASYANVGWLFGLHDRPWGRRNIFGTIRYMNEAGLRRKFDMEAYVKRVEAFGSDQNGLP